MKINYLKKLAEEAASQKEIDAKISTFVLQKLSRSELRQFVQYLKRELARRTLTVTSATPLKKGVGSRLLAHFDKKYLDNKIDPNVGAGLVIASNDDIIDLSLMGEIRRFIRTIA